MLRKAKKRRDSGTRSRVSKERWRSKDHLAMIHRHACLICGAQPIQAHHCRKLNQANGLAPRHDYLTVPLCLPHHKMMDGNEREVWRLLGNPEHLFIRRASEEGRKAIEALSLRGAANT
jgi:hypothetical protein